MTEQEKKSGWFLTTAAGVWRGLDFFRRLVLNIVFAEERETSINRAPDFGVAL
jgi:hypothetical protein